MSNFPLQALSDTPAFRHAPRYQALVICLLAAVTGILIDDRFDLDYRIYILIGLASILAWGLIFIRQSNIRLTVNVPPQVGAVCLMIGLINGFASWHHVRWNWFGENDICRFVSDEGTPVCVQGIVVTEPRWLTPNDSDDGMNYRKGTVRTRLEVKVKRIRDRVSWQTISGKLDLVIHCRTQKFRSGDEVQVFGKLVALQPPGNPGQFDFRKHYRAQGKLVVLHAYFEPSVQIIHRARISIFRPLSLLRAELNEMVWRYMNPDEASFASAIMLGNREQLSAERRESFLKTGTSHLLAISGLHVGILASTFFFLFRIGILNRKPALLMTIAFVIFYAWLVEFRPPALRAAVLIVTFCIGKLLGKAGFSFNLLSLAGLIVLLFNPRDLFNVGAQLSFLAVATLNFGSSWIFWPPSNDPLDRLIENTRSSPVRSLFWIGRYFRTAFLVSGVIWFISLPLVAYNFNLIAPIALLVNPLLLIPLSLALYSGLALMVIGFVSSPLAYLAGKFCEWSLSLVESTIQFAEQIPAGHAGTSGPTTTAIFCFYIGLFFVAVYPWTRLRFRWVGLFTVVWFFSCWWIPDQIDLWRRGNQNGRLVCTFIDVNHGSAVLVQMPDGKKILYDAGSFGSSVFGYRSISGVLWSERIQSIDTVVISHADLDHYNALPELSRRFGIGEVITTQRTLSSRSGSVQAVFSHLRSIGIPIRLVDSESQSGRGERNFVHSNIRILSPSREGTGGNDNSDSIVLLIEVDGYRILLTGDLEGPGLKRLIAQSPIDCDLVMAPHHGSFNSDPTAFMIWTSPQTIVISGETQRIRENSFEIFQMNGREVWRTDRHGAVRCIVENGTAKVQHWQGGRWNERPENLPSQIR